MRGCPGPSSVPRLNAWRRNRDGPRVGGILIRDTDGNPVDRTRWIPRAEWYQRMQATPEARIPGGQWAVARAVSLAIKGEPMNPQQRRSVVWMLNETESYAAWREEEARAAAEQIAA